MLFWLLCNIQPYLPDYAIFRAKQFPRSKSQRCYNSALPCMALLGASSAEQLSALWKSSDWRLQTFIKTQVSKTLPENTASHPYYTVHKLVLSYSLCHFHWTFNYCFDLCKTQATKQEIEVKIRYTRIKHWHHSVASVIQRCSALSKHDHWCHPHLKDFSSHSMHFCQQDTEEDSYSLVQESKTRWHAHASYTDQTISVGQDLQGSSHPTAWPTQGW